jgi:hypothetical protein
MSQPDAQSHADKAAWDALHQAHQTHDQIRRGIAAMAPQPADLHTLVFGDPGVDPSYRSIRHVNGSGQSVGVLNPNPITVWIAIGGGTATPGGRGVPVPPTSLLVLPVAVNQPELGIDVADPDLAGGTAVVFVLLYPTVQPAAAGVLA